MKKNLSVVIIGGVAAGTKAAAKARRDNPDLDITIVTEEDDISYAGCGLAYYIGGVTERREQLFSRSVEEFRTKSGVDVLIGHRAECIDSFKRTLLVRVLATGEERLFSWDRLLIATGAKAIIPPIPGVETQGVFPLRTISDMDRIIAHMDRFSPRDACILGGGYVGLEAAENLSRKGINCTIIERDSSLLSRLMDEDMAKTVLDEVVARGVTVLTGRTVDIIEAGSDGVVSGVRSGNERIPCGMVILATGVKPAVQLAHEARIALGPTGAIRVNQRMETSVRGIYAAGDCAETTHLVSGQSCWFPLGSTANKQGRVAGANIAGGSRVFEGVVGTAITKVFSLAVGRTGLSAAEATAAGFHPVTATVTTPVNASYYPSQGSVTVKLIADQSRQSLLGAQATGTGGVDKAIDTVATALTGKLSLSALANLDLAYAPPYALPLGAVITAAGMLEDNLRR